MTSHDGCEGTFTLSLFFSEFLESVERFSFIFFLTEEEYLANVVRHLLPHVGEVLSIRDGEDRFQFFQRESFGLWEQEVDCNEPKDVPSGVPV